MEIQKNLTAAAMGYSGNETKDFVLSFSEFADVLGAGWNLGNSLEATNGFSPNETAWGNPQTTQEIIDTVAKAGFSTVRIPVSYLDRIDDSNSFKVDEAWLGRIQEVVDYCRKAGLIVIINVHGDGYNTIDGGWLLCNGDNQEYIKKKYAALWRQVAEKFADYDESLIFESMNEVFDGIYHKPVPRYYRNLNDYNQIFVDTVRAVGGKNSHRWLMVPGWNTNIKYTCGNYGFIFPDDKGNSSAENRLILSVHCYDPWDYCGDEKKLTCLWGEKGRKIIGANSSDSAKKAVWGEEKHIETQLDKLKRLYVDRGIPVIIGEYGCIDKTFRSSDISHQIAENRAYYDSFVAGAAAARGIPAVYWDNGYNGHCGFALFDRYTCTQTQPDIINAIITAVRRKMPKVCE